MRLSWCDMRALVISDIHGNIDTLRGLELEWGHRLLRRLRSLDLPERVFEQLARTFRTGS